MDLTSQIVTVHIADGGGYRIPWSQTRFAPRTSAMSRASPASRTRRSRACSTSSPSIKDTTQAARARRHPRDRLPTEPGRPRAGHEPSRTIGVLTAADRRTTARPRASRAIEQAAQEAGYRLSITSITSGDYVSIKAGARLPAEPVGRGARRDRAAGAGVRGDRASCRSTVPFVTLQSTDLGGVHSISVDQVAGARMATRHLIDLGHTEIMHISGPAGLDRGRGADAGLPPRDQRGRAAHARPDPRRLERALRLLRGARAAAVPRLHRSLREQRPDGARLHARLPRLGLDVPGDISVVGFDDIPEAAHFSPPLTTVRQNFAEIGRRAVSLLIAELRGDGHRRPRADHARARRAASPPRPSEPRALSGRFRNA